MLPFLLLVVALQSEVGAGAVPLMRREPRKKRRPQTPALLDNTRSGQWPAVGYSGGQCPVGYLCGDPTPNVPSQADVDDRTCHGVPGVPGTLSMAIKTDCLAACYYGHRTMGPDEPRLPIGCWGSGDDDKLCRWGTGAAGVPTQPRPFVHTEVLGTWFAICTPTDAPVPVQVAPIHTFR